MKKNLLAVVVMCAVLLGLSLGLYLLREDPAPPPELDGPTPVSYLFRYERPPLSVQITKPGGEEHTLLRLDYDPTRNLVTDATIPELEGLPLDTGMVNAVLSASRNLTYLELVTRETTNLAQFGLAEPRAIVSLDFEGLGVRTIRIGDVAPGNIGVYIQLEASGTVYLTPIHGLDNFLLSPYDFLVMDVTPIIGWPPDFDSIALAGQVRQDTGEVLIAHDADGDLQLLLPFEHELSPLYAPGMLHSPFGIVAMGVALTHPTGEDFETLGLYPAWSTLTVESREHGSFTVHASRPDEGGMVFLYREGVPVVYTAFSHSLYWLEAQFHHLMSPFAVSPLLEDLAMIDVIAGRRHAFAIEGAGDELAVFAGEQPLDADNFRRFFTTLTSATLEFLEEQPTELGEPVARLHYFYRDGAQSFVHFYASQVPLRHYIRVGEGPSWPDRTIPDATLRHSIPVSEAPVFLTPSAHLERILEDVHKVALGEHVYAH